MWLANDNGDGAEDSSALWRTIQCESHCVKPLFWCSHSKCLSPHVCNTDYRKRLPTCLQLSIMPDASGELLLTKELSTRLQSSHKVLLSVLSWTSLFWEVGCVMWVTVLHLPSGQVNCKRFLTPLVQAQEPLLGPIKAPFTANMTMGLIICRFI